MKKNLFVFTFFLFSFTAFCQELKLSNIPANSYMFHNPGDYSISGSPNMLYNTPNGVQFAGGLKLRVFLGKRISFDTDMVFGRDYVHVGPGIVGIPVWLFFLRPASITLGEEDRFAEFLFYFISMVLSAEHVAYHIPAKNNLDISPYISLLRYKVSYRYGDYSNPEYAGEQFSFALGVEVNKYFKRFQFSPYLEYNMGYSDHLPGFNAGVYCGYYFLHKLSEFEK